MWNLGELQQKEEAKTVNADSGCADAVFRELPGT
jgi:hypothetical protein